MADMGRAIADLETAVHDFNRYGRDEYGRETAYAYVKADVLENALALLKALDVTPEELERLKMCRAECKIDCLLEHYNKIKDELDAVKKAQEPVKPVWLGDDKRIGFYACGVCGMNMGPNPNYCWYCGGKVKWE